MKIHLARLGAPLLAGLLLAACTAQGSPSGTPPASAQPASPAASAPGTAVTWSAIPGIVDEVQPSVVSVLRPNAQGSGVIWNADGTIVTNYHVVNGATSLQVAFADGQRVKASVVATDPRTDLAVIKADRTNVPAATFTDQLPEVGQMALAMGNPIGFENSVTVGIISGLHRSIPGAAQQDPGLVDLIQTDAAISPGNSGGALVNANGDVVGVNVAYIPPNSQLGAVSIGFAIPAPTVKNIVGQLLQTGQAKHPYIGVYPATMTQGLAQRFNIQANHGVVILDVTAGGPADQAGIQPGDVLTEVDGTRLETVEDLLGAFAEHDIGDTVKITLVRNGQQQTVTVTLGELPSSSG